MDTLSPGGHSPAFDAFVDHRRIEDSFEEFDQRVERAYRAALKTHKAEIWNSVKCKLVAEHLPLTPALHREVQDRIAGRAKRLRELFAQLDSDVKSNEPARQEYAQREMERVGQGEPSEVVAEAYAATEDVSHRLLQTTTPEEDDLVSQDEANRYHGLRLSMTSIEQRLQEQYGRAATEHWDILQKTKDAEYLRKLQKASDTYKELLEQNEAYEESIANKQFKAEVARMHRSQVKLDAALQFEDERLAMLEAHRVLKAERAEAAKARRIEMLHRASELKSKGQTSDEIRLELQLQSIQAEAERHDAETTAERMQVLERKRAYMAMVDQLEAARGQDELGSTMSDGLSENEQREAAALWKSAKEVAGTSASLADQKLAMWELLHVETRNDPRRIVHQARLDAKATYDDTYATTSPDKLRLGRKARRTTSWNLAGGGSEHKILSDPNKEQQTFGWGMNHVDMFNMDHDGRTPWGEDVVGAHAMEPKTGDIDWTREKKLSRGPVFRGPRMYTLGVDAEGRAMDNPMK